MAAVLLVSLAAGGLAGCGAQGTPHPPRLEIPNPVTDLTAVQVGQALDLQCTLPQRATDGERLTKPLEVELLRALAPSGQGLAPLTDPVVWERLTSTQWRAHADHNRLYYSAQLAGDEYQRWRGKTLVVEVRTLTYGFRRRELISGPSNRVDVAIMDVSPPVTSVRCLAAKHAMNVDFLPPVAMLSGQPLHDVAGYRVYRSATGEPGSYELRGETVVPPFQDREFEFGQTYFYVVRVAFGEPGHFALSETSSPVKITPRDIFPPAPPEGLSGIYSAGAVELVWSASNEPDLAGYNVYRLAGDAPTRINKELVRTPVFRDESAPAEQPIAYYVTAVDNSGNESQPSAKEVIETK